MAVPLAKYFGLYVITNGGEAGRQRMIDLGADEFFDYKTEDFSNHLSDIDYMLDTTKEIEKGLSILKSGGKLVSLVGTPNKRFAVEREFSTVKRLMFAAAGSSLDRMAHKQNKEYHFWFMRADGEQLEEITKFVETKDIKPSIDSIFDFKDVKEALAKVDTGHSKGKVILYYQTYSDILNEKSRHRIVNHSPHCNSG